MKKIVLAFSCVFLMSGFAFADDNRYTVISIKNNYGVYVIVDTKKGRIKYCVAEDCDNWKSWGD